MHRRITTICLACLCGIVVIALVSLERTSMGDDKPEAVSETERDRWMAVKLTAAQRIFADLTSGDFERLETNARRMQVINVREQWLREADFEQKSDYQGQLNAFEFSTKELIRSAVDENFEGALQAYVAMTESCVRCHQLIRDVQID